jgi:hypothetical protein
MADNEKRGIFAWLEDDDDDSLDYFDFFAGLTAALSDTDRELEEEFPAAKKTKKKAPAPKDEKALAAVGAGAAAGAAADGYSHVWDEPAPEDDEFKGKKAEKKAKKSGLSATAAEAALVVDSWREDDFGIREDSSPLDILDAFSEGIDPDTDV